MKKSLLCVLAVCSLMSTTEQPPITTDKSLKAKIQYFKIKNLMADIDELQNYNITEFGLKETKQVVFTFDDGPGRGTERILDILKDYNIKATFFALARNIKNSPELTQRIVSEGHILANHTTTHEKLSKNIYSEQPELLLKDLLSSHETIIHYSPNDQFYYFRAPYGAWTNGHADNLNQNETMKKYIGPIMWNSGSLINIGENNEVKDAADWECWSTKKYPEFQNPAVCAEGYIASIERNKGGVVLFHDIHLKTADLIEYLIPRLIEKGYEFVNLNQLDELKLYEMQQDQEFFQQRRVYHRNRNR